MTEFGRVVQFFGKLAEAKEVKGGVDSLLWEARKAGKFSVR